jgi:hypothetical protein
MKRGLVTLAVMFALIVTPMRSHANILTSAAVGLSFGIMGGTLAMILSNDPAEHTNYATIGAAVGFAFGLALGLSEYTSPSSPALSAFYEDGGQKGTEREHIYGLSVNLPFNNATWHYLGL